MKKIADMTMWFLPGTCIATLFALPFLPAQLAAFWVYWIFAIPVTLLMVGIRYSWFSRTLVGTKKHFAPTEKQSNHSAAVGIHQKRGDDSPMPGFHSASIKRRIFGKDGVRVVATESEIPV